MVIKGMTVHKKCQRNTRKTKKENDTLSSTNIYGQRTHEPARKAEIKEEKENSGFDYRFVGLLKLFPKWYR